MVIEATPAPPPAIPASEEINVTSTDSEVEIVTVGDGFRWAYLRVMARSTVPGLCGAAPYAVCGVSYA